MRSKTASVLVLVLVACSSNETGSDAGPDATSDATADVTTDAKTDATSKDAATDGSSDASDASDASFDASDAHDASDAAEAGDAQTAYAHTIVIDGTNDFASVDTFTTTSNGYTAYVSWDATYVYVGMNGSDVGSASSNKWVLVYFGGTSGTTTGVTYNTQTPTLPFSARYHVRWKTDNTFTDALTYNGASWVDANWNFTGDVFQNGNYIEMRFARTDIGSPTTSLPVAISMLNETNSVESTYAGVPSTTFTDGYNPTWTKYFDFDLTSPTVPNLYAPKP